MTDTTPGTIIVLNGSPSAGKTSIAKAVQQTFEAPYLHVGIDLFWLQVFPWEWAGAATNSIDEVPIEGTSPAKTMHRVQPFGCFFISGLHHMIAALARMGHNVVVDHVFSEPRYVADILTHWDTLPVWLVGVSCPLETVRQRAAARTDRRWPSYLPMVTWIYDEAHVHTRGSYDLDVDTSRFTPAECAIQIKHMLDERGAPSAFKHLATLTAATTGQDSTSHMCTELAL